jgi:hypothetical protein
MSNTQNETVSKNINVFRDELDKQYFKKWLHDILLTNVVVVKFTKNDGTERTMKCTLQPSLISQYEAKTERKKEPNEHVLPVWDLECSGWRSFRIDSVKEISFSF